MLYDAALRLQQVTHAKSSTILARTDYLYDKNGNRTKETINRNAAAQVTNYRYDNADRLTQTELIDVNQTVTTDYTLDAVANRSKEIVTTKPAGTASASTQTKTYTYDGRNQLTAIADTVAGDTTLSYDSQGNLLQKSKGSDITAYSYNARDNLISVRQNSTVLGNYRNDHLGLRVEKEAKDPLQPNAPPVTLRTLWNGRHAFQDSDTSGNTVSRYENDGRHTVSFWSSTDGSQALHHDALGSIVASTDTAGQLKSETIYDAFGNISSQSGQSANKFGYTGHQMDKESGLIYFQARYYDPQTGRFLTQDPYEGDWNTPLSLHHYLYAYGNPTVYVDRDGHSATVAGGIGGFFWGFGQMAGGMINDLKNGESRSTSQYFGIWGQNIVAGVEIGASIDIGVLSGGTAAAGSGALGGAGANSLTLAGKGSSGKEFIEEQIDGAKWGMVGGYATSKLMPVLGKAASWVGSKLPAPIKETASTVAQKAGAVVDNIASRAAQVETAISSEIANAGQKIRSALTREGAKKELSATVTPSVQRTVAAEASNEVNRAGTSAISLSELRALKEMGLTQSGRRAAVEGYDLGLGLTRAEGNSSSLVNFARSQNAKIYNAYKGNDTNLFNSAFPGSYEKLQSNLLFSMDRAKNIKINLNGVVESVGELPSIVQRGQLGIGHTSIDNLGRPIGNVTNWEISQILTNPAYTNKSIFFLNGKQVKLP